MSASNKQNNKIQHEFVVVFDGACNLCTSSVIFIIKHDKRGRFKFVQAQSATGKRLLAERGITALSLQSIVFMKNGDALIKSDAVLEIAKNLDGFLKIIFLLKIIPRFMRNAIYDFFARNRYRWFGKKQSCMVPTKELEKRFLK